MGQSATLYRIDKNDFSKIDDNIKQFNVLELTKGYEFFSKSFDGLVFVLSKNLKQQDIELIQQIFYPKNFFGKIPDFSDIGFENLPDNFNFEPNIISYNTPNSVSEISNLLGSISTSDFCKNFNHVELNQKDIYPGDIWNDKKDEDVAFNVQHMSEEFERMKVFYEEATEAGDYILSYVG